MTLKSKVVTGLGWTAGANLLGQLITWTITIVVMRILTPADYGLLAMASVFVAFLAMMASAGLGPAIVQAREIDENKLRQLLGLIVVLNGALFLLLFLSAPLIADFFNETRLTNILRVLSTQFVITGFAVIPDSMLGRQLQFRARALVDLASNVAGGVVTLTLALSGYGVWSLVIGNMISVSGKAIGLNLTAPFFRWPTFSLQGTRQQLAFGGNVTATRVLWFFYSQSDMFIAGKLLGKELLGFYSVAMHLASLPVQKLSAVLNQVVYPAFASIQHDRQLIAAHFLKAIRILCFFAFPILWGISSLAPELVSLLLGDKWDQAILPLQVLPAIMPLRMVGNLLPSAVDAAGRPDLSLKNVILASAVMPIAFYVGALWGIEGLCIAWLTIYPLVFIGNLLRTLPTIGLTILELSGAMILPAFGSAVMYGVIFITRNYLTSLLGVSSRLFVLIVIGAAVYLSLALMIDRDSFKSIIRTFRRS